MQSRTYEVTFAGEAGAVLRAEFDDCEVSVGSDATTLRLEVPDQGALYELLHRIASFGLELIDVSVVAPPLTSAKELPSADRLNPGQRME